MAAGIALLAALVAVGVLAGLVQRSRSGRVRLVDGGAHVGVAAEGPAVGLSTPPLSAPSARSARLASAPAPSDTYAPDLVVPDASLSVIQFSTPMCSRCPGTARMAGSLAGERDGVEHVQIDLVDRPELASRFHVSSTPTLLLVDDHGDVRYRINGAPTRASLSDTIDTFLRGHDGPATQKESA